MALKKSTQKIITACSAICSQCGYQLEPSMLRCPRCFKSVLKTGCEGCKGCGNAIR